MFSYLEDIAERREFLVNEAVRGFRFSLCRDLTHGRIRNLIPKPSIGMLARTRATSVRRCSPSAVKRRMWACLWRTYPCSPTGPISPRSRRRRRRKLPAAWTTRLRRPPPSARFPRATLVRNPTRACRWGRHRRRRRAPFLLRLRPGDGTPGRPPSRRRRRTRPPRLGSRIPGRPPSPRRLPARLRGRARDAQLRPRSQRTLGQSLRRRSLVGRYRAAIIVPRCPRCREPGHLP